jgi:hypothetical protein
MIFSNNEGTFKENYLIQSTQKNLLFINHYENYCSWKSHYSTTSCLMQLLCTMIHLFHGNMGHVKIKCHVKNS